MHGAALPRGAGKDLPYRTTQPLVGIACHADDAICAPLAQRAQESQPPGVGFGVYGVEPEKAPASVRPRPYGRRESA